MKIDMGNRSHVRSRALILIVASLLTASVMNYPGTIKSAYAANDYYLGNGVQADTYYTYKIQDHDTVQGQPFLMTIYFKQFNSTWQVLDCSNNRRIPRQGIQWNTASK